MLLLGETGEDLGGSELLKVVHGRVAGRPPRLDLAAEKRLHALVLEAAAAGCCARPTTSATAASPWPWPSARSAARSPASADASTCRAACGPTSLLFSESPSRMIVTTRDEARLRRRRASTRRSLPPPRHRRGRQLTLVSGSRVLASLPVDRLHEAWMSLEAVLRS